VETATTQTVLVVDDDRANLEVLGKIFQSERLDVVTARGGREALEVLR